jgi:E3 ubiquitin-protein ligase RNF14
MEHFMFGCEHLYCKECLKGYLTVNIIEGAVMDLTCPDPSCDYEITREEVTHLCDAPIVKKYEEFTVIAALRTDPNIRWCPNPTCSSLVRIDPQNLNYVTKKWTNCGACHVWLCIDVRNLL